MQIKKQDPFDGQEPDYSRLDTSKSKEGLWLTTVPEFIMKGWDELKTTTQIGTLTIEEFEDGSEPKAFIVLNSKVKYPVPYKDLPEEFQIRFRPTTKQSEYCFSHGTDTGYVRVAGRIDGVGTITSDDKKKMMNSRKMAQVPPLPAPIYLEIAQEANIVGVTPSAEKDIRKREVKDKRLRKTDQEIKDGILLLFRKKDEATMQEICRAVDQPENVVRNPLNDLAVFDRKDRLFRLKDDFKFNI